MNKKSVRKGESLIVNGSFDKDEWFEGWKKGAPPHDTASLEEPDYDGGRIYVARLVVQATLEQKFLLPVLRGAGVTHVLSFLYQSTLASGFFRIACDDAWGENMELPVGAVVASDDPPYEIPPVEDPLDFTPTYREHEVKLQPNGRNESLAVLFGFPDVPEPAGMSFTRVHFGIQLEPLQLVHVQVDGQTHADGTVYVCRGAGGLGAHRLTFQEAAGGAWPGSEVALLMADENEDLDPNVVIAPELGTLQMLENPWSFTVWNDASVRVLELMIVSKWDAEPYPLKLSIGDHRVALADPKNGDFDPIVNKQSVRLTGTVKSFYTDLPLVGRRVVWLLEGESKVTHTDSSGGVDVEYSPAVAGLQQVNIAIDSLYYTSGELNETLQVKVLVADPFDTAQVAFEGGAQSSWGSRTGYPHRGGMFTVRVSASPGSELPDYPLKLIWEGESAESLGITVTPPLNTPVDWQSGEVVWTLDCTQATKDGEFELLLAAKRLQDTSSSNRMSLGLNRYIVGDTRQANRSPVIDQAESVQVLLQLVEPETREGVENVEVEWQTPGGLVKTFTGQGGWTELSCQPTKAGPQDLVATIQVRGEDGETLEETFPFTAWRTNPWKAEVEWTIGNPLVPAALGFVCWRGETVILTLTPKPGSQLLDKEVTLDWRDGDPGLGLTFDPPIGVPKKLTATGLQWKITGGITKSGRFELKLSAFEVISQDLELSGRLISRNLADEGRVSLDTTSVLPAVSSYPCLGAKHAFSFLPNPLGPLSGLSMVLDWNGIPVEQLNVIVEPAVGTGIEILSGGARWSLDCRNSQHAGDFSLQLTLPQLAMSSTSMAMSLGHNRLEIIGHREATIRPVLAENESARVWVQVGSFYTKAPVANIPVSWKGKDDTQALIVPTRGDGWSSYAYQPKTTGPGEVKAEVNSPYTDQSSSASLEVDALPTSPWLDMVFYRDLEPGQKLGKKTAFPRRANDYLYSIAPSVTGNPLMNIPVRLGWAGTLPNDLSVTVAPALGDKRPMGMAGLKWGAECGDKKDGSFRWFAEAANLLELSPQQSFSLGIPYDQPMPSILQADDNCLNLALFAGNPVINIGLWDGIKTGQLCWLSCRCTSASGRVEVIQLWNPASVVASEITAGRLRKEIPRDKLAALGNLTELEVIFSWGETTDKNKAISCPVARYTVIDLKIAEADGDMLNLAVFDGNAEIKIAIWDGIRIYQKVWLSCEDENGKVIELRTVSDVTAQEVINGLNVKIPRDRLSAMDNGVRLDVILFVTFNGSNDKSTAASFPVARYTLVDLKAPTIDKAVGNALKLAEFSGNPTIKIAAWKGIEENQYVWLSCKCTSPLGSVEVFDLRVASIILSQELNGLSKEILRSLLEAAVNLSTLEVIFSWGKTTDKNKALSFPVATYTVHL